MVSLQDDDSAWAEQIDVKGNTVWAKAIWTNQLPICGQGNEGGLARCVIMLYDGRRHDSPCIMHPIPNDLTIVEIHRVAHPPGEVDLYD